MVEKKDKKIEVSSEWSGFFMVAWLSVVGIILFYTPIYIGISGVFKVVVNALGWIAIIISFAGALIELSNIFKNDGFSYIGTSLVFLIPAILLHISQERYLSNPTVIVIIKTVVIILIIIGSAFILLGVSAFIGTPSDKFKKSIKVQKSEDKKNVFELLAPILIAILSVTTAIIKLISEIS